MKWQTVAAGFDLVPLFCSPSAQLRCFFVVHFVTLMVNQQFAIDRLSWKSVALMFNEEKLFSKLILFKYLWTDAKPEGAIEQLS